MRFARRRTGVLLQEARKVFHSARSRKVFWEAICLLNNQKMMNIVDYRQQKRYLAPLEVDQPSKLVSISCHTSAMTPRIKQPGLMAAPRQNQLKQSSDHKHVSDLKCHRTLCSLFCFLGSQSPLACSRQSLAHCAKAHNSQTTSLLRFDSNMFRGHTADDVIFLIGFTLDLDIKTGHVFFCQFLLSLLLLQLAN